MPAGLSYHVFLWHDRDARSLAGCIMFDCRIIDVVYPFPSQTPQSPVLGRREALQYVRVAKEALRQQRDSHHARTDVIVPVVVLPPCRRRSREPQPSPLCRIYVYIGRDGNFILVIGKRIPVPFFHSRRMGRCVRTQIQPHCLLLALLCIHLDPPATDTIAARVGAQRGGPTTDGSKSGVRGGGRARKGRRGAAVDAEAGPPAEPSRPREVGRTGLGRRGRHCTTARRGSVKKGGRS